MALGQQGQLQHVSWVNNNTTTAGSCKYYSVLNIFLPQYLRLHGAARLVTGYISEQFPWWRPAAVSAMVPIYTLACDNIRAWTWAHWPVVPGDRALECTIASGHRDQLPTLPGPGTRAANEPSRSLISKISNNLFIFQHD